MTSPGPLHSPGSSSDSNGGDAEGPGPPAPVSDLLPPHSLIALSPLLLGTSTASPRVLPDPPLPSPSCHFLLTLLLKASVPPPHWYFLVLLCPWPLTLATPPAAVHCGAVLQVTFQQICKDVHLVKHQGQQLFIESRARPQPRPRLPGELVTMYG